MYLLDDRFPTVVAFLEGFNAAFDGAPLSGFQRFVSSRVLHRESSQHWAYIIASTRVPAVLDDGSGLEQVPAESDAELTSVLLELLDEYQRM
jgi:hypothetical protein